MEITPTGPGAGLRALAMLLRKKTPLHEALIQTADFFTNRGHRSAWKRVASAVNEGMPYTEAFRQEGHRFPPGYAEILVQALESGDAPSILIALAAHHDLNSAYHRDFYKSIIPLISVLIGTIVFGIVWSFHMVPLFRESYFHMGIDAPAFIHPLSSLIWIVPAIGVFGFILAMHSGGTLFRKGSVRKIMDTAIWLRTLAICLKTKMPLHQALAVSGSPHGSDLQSRAGESLDTILSETPHLPSSLAAVLGTAEKRGTLPAICERYGRLYYRFAMIRMHFTISRLVPLLLIICALIAGCAVLTGYLIYFNTLGDAAEALMIW